METIERRYAMVRVAKGDYILPRNDGLGLWRIATYHEDGSAGFTGEFWATWKYDRPFHNAGEWTDPDFLEWGQWLHWSGPFATRKEAVENALRHDERSVAMRER